MTLEDILTTLRYGKGCQGRGAARNALRELKNEGFSPEDGVRLIEAAAKFGDDPGTAGLLLRSVYADARPEYIAPLKANFAAYGEEARDMALLMLSLIEEREAAEALMAIIREYAHTGELSTLPFGPLEREPRHAEVFFPEILDYAKVPAFRAQIYLFTQTYLAVEAITPDDLGPVVDSMIASLDDYMAKATPFQGAETDLGYWDEDYLDLRAEFGILLELLSTLNIPAANAKISEAMTLTDPRLLFLAIRPLLGRGETPEQVVLERIAASREMRSWLYERLDALEMNELFPAAYRDQILLAESDLVIWLTYPNQLGFPPDEIEFMKTVPYKMRTDIFDFFVFRYRTLKENHPHKGEWLAGIAGPFSRRKEMRGRANGTFSRFEPYDKDTPAGHVDTLLDQLEKWHQES